VRARPRIDSSITSLRSSITAFDCSGVKPCASSRWTTLSVSKFVDREDGDVLKFRTVREGINRVVRVECSWGCKKRDGRWRRGCIVGSNTRRYLSIGLLCPLSVPNANADHRKSEKEI